MVGSYEAAQEEYGWVRGVVVFHRVMLYDRVMRGSLEFTVANGLS